jgi:hypothetical protein
MQVRLKAKFANVPYLICSSLGSLLSCDLSISVIIKISLCKSVIDCGCFSICLQSCTIF